MGVFFFFLIKKNLIKETNNGYNIPYNIRISTINISTNFQNKKPNHKKIITNLRIDMGVNGASCKLCNSHDEDVQHLFFSCPVAFHIWSSIFFWLGVCFVSHCATVIHFLQFSVSLVYSKLNGDRFFMNRCDLDNLEFAE